MAKTQTFRIWPDNHFLHFKVFIHPSKKAMHKACANCAPYNFEAICRSGEKYFIPAKGPEIFSGEIGTIHFYRGFFKAGILAHELTHATFTYFEWRKDHAPLKFPRERRNSVSNSEEAFCWVQGNLMRQACISSEQGKEFRPRHKPPSILPRAKHYRIRMK